MNGFSLSESKFEDLISIKPSDAVTPQAIFKVLDQNCDGRIDGLEFVGGLIICCQGSFEEKARCTYPFDFHTSKRYFMVVAFEFYDFNLNGSLSPTELVRIQNVSVGISVDIEN